MGCTKSMNTRQYNPKQLKTDEGEDAHLLLLLQQQQNERELQHRRRFQPGDLVFINGNEIDSIEDDEEYFVVLADNRQRGRVQRRPGRGGGKGRSGGKGKGGGSKESYSSRSQSQRGAAVPLDDDFGRSGGKGKGGGSKESYSSRSRSQRGAAVPLDDDFFPRNADWVNAARSKDMIADGGGSVGGFIANGIGSGVILARPFRGTGIGRIDRRPPRPARGGGNQFPEGFRPNMIRGPAGTPFPSLAPTSPGPGVPTSPGSGAPTSAGLTLAPTSSGVTAAPTVPGATVAPTNLATNDFIIESTFALTYFSDQPTDVDRDLTAEEYAELATLMDEFYTEAFRTDPAFSDDFISFMTEFTSMMYTMGAYVGRLISADFSLSS